LEEIIKMWMKKNYDVDIDYIDYYYWINNKKC
jgi:hypothetical protein